MRKSTKKLSLHVETLHQLSLDEVTKIAGAYPPSAPQSCGCQGSGVSQCVCSTAVSVCW